MDDFLTKIRRRLIAGKYSLTRRLGEGGFGAVYLAHDEDTSEDVALKLEHRDKGPILAEEYERYLAFQDDLGFPKVYWYGWHDDFKVMSMELLGPSLDDLLAYCGGRFTLKTTLMIADQLLERLETLHNRGLLHRDVKPANCLLGRGRAGNTMYITDFGLVQDYDADKCDALDDRPDRLHLIGTARFASIRGHRGSAQYPQDDLESLGYMLVYFSHGSLPWQGLKATDKTSKDSKILGKKLAVTIDELCVDLPCAFADFMRIARSAPREDGVDYRSIRAMFHKAARAGNIEYDQVYDWTVRRYFEELQDGR